VIGCTGECGSLVLRLQIADSVPNANIAAVETAVAANPALIAIAIVTADGGTVGLAPSTFVFQGVAPAATNTVNAAQPATGKQGKKGNKKAKRTKKGKKGKDNKVGNGSTDATAKGKVAKGKLARDAAAKGKKGKKGKRGKDNKSATGKGKKAKRAAKLTLQTVDGAEPSLAVSTSRSSPTQVALLFGLLGVAMLAAGATRHARARAAALLCGSAADSSHFADSSEKSPLVASGTTQSLYS